MKTTLTLLSLLLLGSVYAQNLTPAQEGGKFSNWGYQNESGEFVIPANFYNAAEFDNKGYAFVYNLSDSTMEKGPNVINAEGVSVLDREKVKAKFENPDELCTILGPAGNAEFYVCKHGEDGRKAPYYAKIDIEGNLISEWMDGDLSFYSKAGVYVKRFEKPDLANNKLDVSEQVMKIDGTMVGEEYDLIIPLDKDLYYAINGEWVAFDTKTSAKVLKKKPFFSVNYDPKVWNYYYFELQGSGMVLNGNFEKALDNYPFVTYDDYGSSDIVFWTYEKGEYNTGVIYSVKISDEAAGIDQRANTSGDNTGKGKGQIHRIGDLKFK